MTPNTLLCTVGTSLLNATNFGGTHRGDWAAVAAELAAADGADRRCGAEVNSVASLLARGYVAAGCGIYFFHSDTDAGRDIARVLVEHFARLGHAPAAAVPVADLQDKDPKRFRTKGLRNLAKAVCAAVRDHTPAACAINATGGYKAQIAVAVLLGQAVGVPVYYKHELFDEIIPFPPLPVAFDYRVWMKASGLLAALERGIVPRAAFGDEWDEKYECLVNAEEIDGVEYLELSPTGQILRELFRDQFRSDRDHVLPPAAGKKQRPHFEDAGWPGTFPDAVRFVTRVTDEVPFVTRCATHYYNPDLSTPTRFRPSRDGVEGVYSAGGRAIKFRVETTAKTPGQVDASIAALNDWLDQ